MVTHRRRLGNPQPEVLCHLRVRSKSPEIRSWLRHRNRVLQNCSGDCANTEVNLSPQQHKWIYPIEATNEHDRTRVERTEQWCGRAIRQQADRPASRYPTPQDPVSAFEAVRPICDGRAIGRGALDFSARPATKHKLGDHYETEREEVHRAGPTR
jgi:hypothetical protein